MKPSPPKNPAPSFFWKWTERLTELSQARKPLFWRTSSRPGPISKVRMEPGNEEYRRLYQTLQSGGTAYRQRQGGLSNMGELLYCCAMAACLGSCMYGGMCYPVFCCY